MHIAPRFTRTLQRQCREFTYILHTTCPNVNTLYNHRTFFKTKKLTLVQNYYLDNRLYLDITSFSLMSHGPIQSPILHSVSSDLCGRLSVLLIFYDLVNFKEYLFRIFSEYSLILACLILSTSLDYIFSFHGFQGRV